MDATGRVNPYIAGSPVTGTEMFFGREDVFSFVRRNLTGRHRDTPIVLYGQRRTGKTSVLYQMPRHLDSRYRCIFIDLHGLSLNGMENLLWGIVTSIKRGLQRDHQLSVEIPDRATFSADPQAAFETTFLDAVWPILGEDHLVLMIDEVVRLHEEVRAGRLEPEVFDYLRHLMQHFERLNFVFSLGSGVEEMKKDYAFLFGVALYHRISFLEPMTARELVTKPAQDCYLVMPDAAEKILQITSGHPYYTQLICHCLFDRWLRAPKPQMTSADVDAVLAEAIELGSANLTYVWEDSTSEEQAMMAGMAAALPAGGSATADQIREVWHKAGVWLPTGQAAIAARNLAAREVVVASDGAYSFTVDLQRLWLGKHRRLDWVKQELEESARSWSEKPTPEQDRSAEGKPSHQQHTPRSLRRPLLLAGSGILAVVVIILLFIFMSNSHSASNSRSASPALAKSGSSTKASSNGGLGAKIVPAPPGFALSQRADAANGPMSATDFNHFMGSGNLAAGLHFVRGYDATYDNISNGDVIDVDLFQFTTPADATAFKGSFVPGGSITTKPDPVIPGGDDFDSTTSNQGTYLHGVIATKGNLAFVINYGTGDAAPVPMVENMARHQYAAL